MSDFSTNTDNILELDNNPDNSRNAYLQRVTPLKWSPELPHTLDTQKHELCPLDVGDDFKTSILHYPAILPTIYESPLSNNLYFVDPGVIMIARTVACVVELEHFLDQFGLGKYHKYYLDLTGEANHAGHMAAKFAGQLCYLSFDGNYTDFQHDSMMRYFRNLTVQKHGSVLEHVSYTVLLFGVSRSFTHELVRHRVGIAFSQQSQRYCNGSQLRFVMHPDMACVKTSEGTVLRTNFYETIKASIENYEARAKSYLEVLQSQTTVVDKKSARIAVNQAARECLPNETEAPIVVTVNGWQARFMLNRRGSQAAERNMRRVAVALYRVLVQADPIIFQGFEIHKDSFGYEYLVDTTLTVDQPAVNQPTTNK